MEMNVYKSEVEDFVNNKLGKLLVDNTTNFNVAAFVLQAVIDKMKELED